MGENFYIKQKSDAKSKLKHGKIATNKTYLQNENVHRCYITYLCSDTVNEYLLMNHPSRTPSKSEISGLRHYLITHLNFFISIFVTFPWKNICHNFLTITQKQEWQLLSSHGWTLFSWHRVDNSRCCKLSFYSNWGITIRL